MHRLDRSRTVAGVRLASADSITSVLPHRLRNLAPEAVAFGMIGVVNALLYFAIFNLTMAMGAVKATVVATAITTTLAYVGHRYWTYRGRSKSTVRREYVLFVGFNLAGMLIQSGVIAVGKYGFGLNETRDRIWFNVATLAGIALATMFRFWAYRTLVFRPHPADHAPPTTAAEALAEAYAEEEQFQNLTAPLEVELRAQRAAAEDHEGFSSSTAAGRNRSASTNS
jgi:putative flippase GtrA